MSNLNIANANSQTITDQVLDPALASQIVDRGVRDDQTVAHPVPTTDDWVLTDAALLYASRQMLIINATGMTAARSLTLGADTAARALELQQLFGINRFGGNVVLKMHTYGTQAAFALSLANTSGATAAHVGVRLNAGAAANTQVLSVASAVENLGNIVIWVIADNVTPGAERIDFNICCQGLATAP